MSDGEQNLEYVHLRLYTLIVLFSFGECAHSRMMAYTTLLVCHNHDMYLTSTSTLNERFVRFSYVPRSLCHVRARYSYGAVSYIGGTRLVCVR